MTDHIPRIALVGQPNCGKSTLFNAIAGFKAQTSNFAGTTVEFLSSRVKVDGRVVDIVDLPGIYSLATTDLAERETLKYLLSENIDVIINVIDASLLSRGLELTLQLMELEKPMVIALNMVDEAERKGIKIDIAKLEKILGVPVVATIAVHGKGIYTLMKKVFEVLKNWQKPNPPRCSKPVENAIKELAAMVSAQNINLPPRLVAIKLMEGHPEFIKFIGDPQLIEKAKQLCRDLEEEFERDCYEIIHQERHHTAMRIFEQVATVTHGSGVSSEERIDRTVMHPIFGYLILALVFLGMFYVAFSIGGYLEELVLSPFDAFREYLAAHVTSRWLPLIDGLVSGIGGGIGIVLPYLVPLIFLMSLLEDLGYLARAAFLLDVFMHKIGLHGKSVVPLLVGYGCNVPSIVATRIISSERDRVLTALLAPFVPCSARTTVILALVGYFMGPAWALLIYVVNIFVVAILGRILTSLTPTPSAGLVMEVPSYKIPSLSITLKKTWVQIKGFITFAWPVLIFSSLFLGLMDMVGITEHLNLWLAPFTRGLLGLPDKLGVTLIFGILRKELTLIMMAQALGTTDFGAVMSYVQMMTFTMFVVFYVPCVSTIAVLWREFNGKVATTSLVLHLVVATIIALLTRFVMLSIGF